MKTTLFLALTMSFSLFAQDSDYLDAPYTHLVHPKISTLSTKSASKNDIDAIMAIQTPVRSQESRGTCSIFSATAYLESLLIQKGSFETELDLSEEWLQYISVRGKQNDGSSAPSNFEAMKNYGMLFEETLPYEGDDWSKTESELKESRCGHLTSTNLKSCLITHFDPKLLLQDDSLIEDQEFVTLRKEARAFKTKHIKFNSSSYYLYDTQNIKDTLIAGTPVILEMDFYYGAWNHRGGEALGIERNMDHWRKGIIGNPEPGSLDAKMSPTKRAGHSVLVVGFDDNRIVKKTIQMADGTKKTFTYKGVYYIKNSWGTDSFGSEFEIDGVKYPGYGMIVQKHANAEGSFFILPLK